MKKLIILFLLITTLFSWDRGDSFTIDEFVEDHNKILDLIEEQIDYLDNNAEAMLSSTTSNIHMQIAAEISSNSMVSFVDLLASSEISKLNKEVGLLWFKESLLAKVSKKHARLQSLLKYYLAFPKTYVSWADFSSKYGNDCDDSIYYSTGEGVYISMSAYRLLHKNVKSTDYFRDNIIQWIQNNASSNDEEKTFAYEVYNVYDDIIREELANTAIFSFYRELLRRLLSRRDLNPA